MVSKLQFERRVVCEHQRSGWAYAQNALGGLVSEHPDAVVLDTMVERNFAREFDAALAEKRIPYRRPWAGVIHVPPDLPPWLPDTRKSPRVIFQTRQWQESLPHCVGLITLSRSLRDWVQSQFPWLPVLALHHPTEFTSRTFSFDSYMQAGQPVVQVGWWLRRLASIHFLDLPKQRKSLLVPHAASCMARFLAAIEAERAQSGAPRVDEWNATILPRLSNEAYDELLTRSLVFLDLHGTSANNAVVECIVRRTPVLIRRHKALEDYLGAAYPLYFDDLDQAAAMAADPQAVLAAHQYLSAMDIGFLSGESFQRGLAESEMYRSWPCPSEVQSCLAEAP